MFICANCFSSIPKRETFKKWAIWCAIIGTLFFGLQIMLAQNKRNVSAALIEGGFGEASREYERKEGVILVPISLAVLLFGAALVLRAIKKPCPSCGSRNIIPKNTPAGQTLLKRLEKEKVTNS